jgi:hypothetical protein
MPGGLIAGASTQLENKLPVGRGQRGGAGQIRATLGALGSNETGSYGAPRNLTFLLKLRF